MLLKGKVINFALYTNLLVMETPKNLNRIKVALADAGKGLFIKVNFRKL